MITATSSNFLWGVATALQIGAVASNAPILLVIWSRGLLTSPNTRLVFSLCLSHLLLCLFLLISGWTPDLVPVLVPTLVSLILQLASLSTLTLISLDRYVSIARPMECSRILTPQRSLLAVGLSWGGAVVLVLPPGLLLSTSTPLRFWWNIYFGLLLSLATIVALVLMTLAYSHIFAIARQKCHKVRLGEFRRAPGSISSEWGTSVGGCAGGGGGGGGVVISRGHLPPPLPRGLSSQSLLQKLLQQRISSSSSSSSSSPSTAPTTASSSRSGSGSSTSTSIPLDLDPTTPGGRDDPSVAGMARAKRRWRAYLRHNYNSPKKTVVTILTLIGSVVVCSLPPALALLFVPSLFPTLQGLLLPLSSNLHPLLYGLLNRAIRHHLIHGKRAALLPKSLRLKRGQRRKVSTLGELRSIFIPVRSRGPKVGGRRRKKQKKVNGSAPSSAAPSRRGSTTSGTEDEFLGRVGVASRPRLDTGQLPGSSRRWAAPPPVLEAPVVLLLEEDDSEEEKPEPEIVVEIHGRRKSSQDSGADMNFSETEDEEVGVVGGRGGGGQLHNHLIRHHPSLARRTSYSESNLSYSSKPYNHTHHHAHYHHKPGLLSPTPTLQLSPLSLSADAHLHILKIKGELI